MAGISATTAHDAPNMAEEMKLRGDSRFRAGDFDAAAAAFAAGLAAAPPGDALHKTLAANLSAAHERRGDFAAALRAADAAVAAASTWGRAHLRRGRALIGLKRFTAAAAALEHGMTLSPGDASLAEGLALARELAAGRAAAIPVSLAASKWPGGNAADGGGGAANSGEARGQDAAAGAANGAAAPAKVGRKPRVTVLSGFLGAGKTTLLNHILAHAHGCKIAVVVNDMAAVNVDAALLKENGALRATEERLVGLTNGCICCSLRADLIEEVGALAAGGRFEHILVESTGVGEPLPVAAAFAAAGPGGGMLADVAQLDTMVTVVDAAGFLPMLQGGAPIAAAADVVPCPAAIQPAGAAGAAVPPKLSDSEQAPAAPIGAAAPEQPGGLARLLIDQVEFANVILLNKSDLVDEAQLQQTEAVLRQLNPTAQLLRCERCAVDLTKVLGTGRFDMAAAAETAGWQQEVDGAPHTPETEEFGISSLVWTDQHVADPRRRFFHPQRLWAAVRAASSAVSSSIPAAFVQRNDSSGGRGVGRSAAAATAATAEGIEHGSANGANGSISKGACSADSRTHEASFPSLPPCLRSKGFFRLAHASQHRWQWSTAGSSHSFTPAGAWPSAADTPLGDRAAAQQTLVFIGVALDKEGIAKTLDACLLTPDEAGSGLTAVAIDAAAPWSR